MRRMCSPTLLLGLLASFPLAAKSSLPQIAAQSSKFIEKDSKREVHLRGVNVVYKDAPWLPTVEAFHSNLSFVEDDAALLASLGVNLVRLGVMWPGLSPANKDAVDAGYVDKIRKLIDMCERHGMYVVVEPHQDEFNKMFCGEGAPDWYLEENHLAAPTFPVPVQAHPFAQTPPTRSECYENSSFSFIWTRDSSRAYQRLYETGADLETGAFARFWDKMAGAFSDKNAVLAGEAFNEPFLGAVFDNAKLRNNLYSDRTNLEPFYANISRAVNGRLTMAYEPTWPVGDQDLHPDSLLPSHSGFSDASRGFFEDNIYAFHYYVPPADPDFNAYLNARVADSRRLKAVPFVSELNLYAHDADSERTNSAQLSLMEEKGIAYTGWQYKSYSGSLPTGTCTGCGNSFFNDDGSAKIEMMRSFARPLARAIGGEMLTVNASNKEAFELQYAPFAGRQSLTEIVVPGLWAEDFDVRVQCAGKSPQVRRDKIPGRPLFAGFELRSWERVTVTVFTETRSPVKVILTVKPAERYV